MRSAEEVNWDSIEDVQKYVTEWADANFPNRTPHQALAKLMLEEIPEMAVAVKEGAPGLEGECADTLILLLDLFKLWGVDIRKGLREKMILNRAREWEIGPDGIAHHIGKTANE